MACAAYVWWQFTSVSVWACVWGGAAHGGTRMAPVPCRGCVLGAPSGACVHVYRTCGCAPPLLRALHCYGRNAALLLYCPQPSLVMHVPRGPRSARASRGVFAASPDAGLALRLGCWSRGLHRAVISLCTQQLHVDPLSCLCLSLCIVRRWCVGEEPQHARTPSLCTPNGVSHTHTRGTHTQWQQSPRSHMHTAAVRQKGDPSSNNTYTALHRALGVRHAAPNHVARQQRLHRTLAQRRSALGARARAAQRLPLLPAGLGRLGHRSPPAVQLAAVQVWLARAVDPCAAALGPARLAAPGRGQRSRRRRRQA